MSIDSAAKTTRPTGTPTDVTLLLLFSKNEFTIGRFADVVMSLHLIISFLELLFLGFELFGEFLVQFEGFGDRTLGQYTSIRPHRDNKVGDRLGECNVVGLQTL